MPSYALIPGRWHAITKDQEGALLASIRAAKASRLIFVITAAEQSCTKRHPLSSSERRELVTATAASFGLPYEIHEANDTADSPNWVAYILQSVRQKSAGHIDMKPENTVVISGNPDVIGLFEASQFAVQRQQIPQTLPSDVLGAIRSGGNWQDMVNAPTLAVYVKYKLAQRVMDLFQDVLLTDDGELSNGRDFKIYSAGMDASLGLKIEDICPWIRPGLIVDKGCGTGKLLVHLSDLFPSSEIIGMDLSRELLHTAEGQTFPHQNVSVVKGNIIQQRFSPRSVSSIIYSSVLHEVFSYNGYDYDQVRLALRNSRIELERNGRLIIRDGIAPRYDGNVWMQCNAVADERFRRFAHDFKRKSKNPGVKFVVREHAGQPWFVLSMHDANEFLSKKDYLENWDIETNEEFGVFNLQQWRDELSAEGYAVIHARSYLNEWIHINRYKGQVTLRADRGNRPGRQLRFPDTTAIIVAQAG